MDVQKIINKINKTNSNNLNISDKYDIIFDCYKTLSIKYILVAEKVFLLQQTKV